MDASRIRGASIQEFVVLGDIGEENLKKEFPIFIINL